MALREIGAKLTLEGEAQWNSQMKAADRELANLKSELAATSAEFSGQANSVDALRAKQELLTRKQEQQREKVRALGQAVADAAAIYGDESVQVDKLTQKYNYAKASLAKMDDEVEENAAYLKEAEASADGCAASIDGYGKKVKTAGDKTKDAANDVKQLADETQDASGNVSGLRAKLESLVPGLNLASVTATAAGAAIAAGIKKAWNAVKGLVDETASLRQQLSTLDSTAAAMGVTLDANVTDAAKIAYEQVGDMNKSLEATQALLKAGFRGEGLTDVMLALRGAALDYDESVDSLASALQKTVASGTVQGGLKDLFKRLGIDTSDFAAQLQESATQAERANLVYETLAQNGLKDLAEAYREANKYSIMYSDATFDMETAKAQLGNAAEPIVAKGMQALTSMAGWTSDLVRVYTTKLGTGGLDTLVREVEKAGETLSESEILDIVENLEAHGIADSYRSIKAAAEAAGQSLGEFLIDTRDKLAAEEEAAAAAVAAAEDAATATANARETAATEVDRALELAAEVEAALADIRAGIESTVNGFKELSDVSLIDADVTDVNKALDSQLDFLDDYMANLQKAKDLGISDALIAELSDGSEQSAQILQEIANSTEEQVAEMNEKFAKIQEGKDKFVDVVASMLPELQDKLDEATDIIESTVEDWDQYDVAFSNGENTVLGYMEGMQAHLRDLQDLGAQLSAAGHGGYTGYEEQNSPSKLSMREAGYTVAGYTKVFRDALPEFNDLGADMSEALHGGYTAESLRYDEALAARTYSRALSSGVGGTVNNSNTTTNKTYAPTFNMPVADRSVADYLIKIADQEWGRAL